MARSAGNGGSGAEIPSPEAPANPPSDAGTSPAPPTAATSSADAVAASPSSAPLTQQLLLQYDENFLTFHAGRVIEDAGIAIIELVANCWDAGANSVKLTWPARPDSELSIEDNGTGMTRTEFERRWTTLNYNRLHEQGENVEFPPATQRRKRTAFGRNGIGRHAMFCFAREYQVETKKDGHQIRARVSRGASSTSPFTVLVTDDKPTTSHGTRIWCQAQSARMSEEDVRNMIGSRFVADPDFKIQVNGREVQLEDLDHLCTKFKVPVEGMGEFLLRRYDCEHTGRTSKQNGVAWWVNKRLVGEPSWEGVTESLIDARTATAKRYTYVVEADILAPQVKPDWTGFHTNPSVNQARRDIYNFVFNDLRLLTKDYRRERKKALLEQNRDAIAKLPVVSQDQIAAFTEELQLQCPTISDKELMNAVLLFANMEKARTGYSLLEKMAGLAPADIDGLESILAEWTVSDARKVLSELRYRLELIKQLETMLGEDRRADELHELQPLFERGLWIFGPEFESLEFMSNRRLATIVRECLPGGETPTTPDKRPDFVVFPERSIGVYARDGHDSRHEVSGFSHIVIVELKRGGSTISYAEKDQATHYVRQLRRSVSKDTRIEAYVLGSHVDPAAQDETNEGNSRIIARSFGVVLQAAHARTFRLLRKLEGAGAGVRDPDLKEVLTSTPGDLFCQD
ncbi:ATP-binding protein [Myxococcus xanthus]|uniref:ATP-binding protein n=1 Tax=Myxococcus xanthus TaxID=34 RepID=UPI0013762C7A|nr:ATP-binding protein [Myxococcus xanthus]